MKEFGNLTSFIAHFATLELAVQHEAERALERSAVLVEETAKEEIGYYQPEKGPFSEWPELADSTLKHHESMGVGDSPLLVTGGLYASIQHETHGHEAVIGSQMDIAAYQEFGTETIPPRPFMGPAAYVNKKKIEKIMANGLVSGLLGGNALALDYDSTE